jgi:hypothetical protein
MSFNSVVVAFAVGVAREQERERGICGVAFLVTRRRVTQIRAGLGERSG